MKHSTLAALHAEERDILDRADRAGRDLTAAEKLRLDEIDVSARRLDALAANSGSPPGAGRIARDLSVERGTAGFACFGAYLAQVREAAYNRADSRLAILNSAAGESIGADGGFAVPPEFRRQIAEVVAEADPVTPRCDQLPLNGLSVTVPVDETTPWSTTGIRAFWTAENIAATATRPQLRALTLKAHKLTCFVPISDELLQDAPALDAWLPRRMGERIAFARQLAVLHGTGIGQPLGVVRGPGTITAARESGQPAGTFTFGNARAMLRRLHGDRRRAAWILHPDHEDSVLGMSWSLLNAAGTAAVASVPLGFREGGHADAIEPKLLGLPVIYSQACAAPGSVGDAILLDGAGYWIAQRELRTEASIHVFFDADQVAFRATLRLAGAPWLSAPIADRAGGSTRSHCVVLEARS